MCIARNRPVLLYLAARGTMFGLGALMHEIPFLLGGGGLVFFSLPLVGEGWSFPPSPLVGEGWGGG